METLDEVLAQLRVRQAPFFLHGQVRHQADELRREARAHCGPRGHPPRSRRAPARGRSSGNPSSGRGRTGRARRARGRCGSSTPFARSARACRRGMRPSCGRRPSARSAREGTRRRRRGWVPRLEYVLNRLAAQGMTGSVAPPSTCRARQTGVSGKPDGCALLAIAILNCGLGQVSGSHRESGSGGERGPAGIAIASHRAVTNKSPDAGGENH